MSTVRLALIVGCAAMVSVIGADLILKSTVSDGPTSEILEHEIRIGLPLGSPLPMVQDFLVKRGAEFSFDTSSKSVRAIIRRLKGSTILTSKSLTLRFDFDQDLKLKNLDTKVVYTGP